MTDFTTKLETTLVETYNRKLEAIQDFLIDQIDTYLLSKSREWSEALACFRLGANEPD